ncbi:MAG: glycine--tRNA ligase [Candidatus Micrarchaeota archaeon]|nr:glycine--tRNA ligase [Candidatus Micrarchaeota archaeon]MDE1804958.1 glycine--tRNA ligase [Candidatus Micrarchaeota archaeon]MDE1846821.1 glycine--tRNA ligase [Candidatus Micrarchaeota archaeon]
MNYEEIMKLALERGFYFQSCEIYPDAPAGFWEYGPTGVSFKNKFVELWRREMIRRDGMLELDGSQIMSKSVFEASGHLSSFADPITKCKKCNSVYRADKLISEAANVIVPESAPLEDFDRAIEEHSIVCPKDKGQLEKVKKFNMMFRVGIGPLDEPAYLRPETCQSLFVDFPRVFKVMRGKLPVGFAQYGKSFRNEISPRQSLIRMREFYQAEIEVFCNPSKLNELERFKEIEQTRINVMLGDDEQPKWMTCKEAVESGAIPNKLVAYYLGLLVEFYEKTGIDVKRHRFRKLGAKEKAFYASVAFDFEVETSLGWLELVACNYRSDYDLTSHAKLSKANFEVMDGEEKVLPHVFELSMGVDRSLYTILDHSLRDDKPNERVVLSVKPYLAPVQVGVLPLMKKDGLYEKADEIFATLKRRYDAFFDVSGAIGRRYRRLDEVGAPFAITIDYQTLQDGTVTLRERDEMKQERIKISDIESRISKLLAYP